MDSLFRYDDGEKFLTIKEFSDEAGCSKEEVVAYIEEGYIFPLVPTRQRVLIRRIPSLLTEHLFNFESDEERYEECVNKPKLHLGYVEYIDTWRNFIKQFASYALEFNKDLSEKCLPRMSDIQFTNGEYIYIGTDVVKELSRFGLAYIKKFVSSRITRGFYHPDSHLDINKFYDRYKFRKQAVQVNGIPTQANPYITDDIDPVSIYSRFSIEFKNIYNKKPSLCYPDYSYSMDYLGILGELLPVTLWAASHYLDLSSNAFLMRSGINSPSCFDALRETETKLKNDISEVNADGDKYLTFFNLVKASSYFDQWIPLYPERNELACTYDSLRLSSTQIEYAKSLKNKTGDVAILSDKSRRDYINYNYCIQRSFIYQLMQYVKKSKRENLPLMPLEAMVTSCIQKAQDQLNNDAVFKTLAKSCSGVTSSDNFFNKLTSIDKDHCSGLFFTASKKSKTKSALNKNKASPDQSASNLDSDGRTLATSEINSSGDLIKLFSNNKSKSQDSS
jgi:hypothetical protein